MVEFYKMKKILILVSLAFLAGCIENTVDKKREKPDQQNVSPLISELVVTEPEEQKFITDIRKLKKLKVVKCDARAIEYQDEVNGKAISLKITSKPFLKEAHKIEYHVFGEKTTKNCLKVDGVRPRGGFYGCPTTELDTIRFIIDGKAVELGDHFKNYYNPVFCEVYQENFNPNPLLTYTEEGYFYIYLMGGKGVDRFLTKFICDENAVLHSYYLDNEKLRSINGYDRHFIGF